MMRKSAIGLVAILGLVAAGCATSKSAKVEETESLQSQVVSLESRIGDLTQRLEELTQQQTPPQPQVVTRAGRHSVATRAKVTLSPREIQLALKSAGFYAGSIDGKLGAKTREAVKTFQRANGLQADGVVGTKTAAALSQYLKPSGSGGKDESDG